MFKSIKWKFITVYFLLVLISMIIVTTFIVKNLETYQVDQISSTMENSIKKLVNKSTYLNQSDNLSDSQEDIQNATREWPISSSERMYIIDTQDKYKIIADTTSIEINKMSAFDIEQIREDLVVNTKKDAKRQRATSSNYYDDGESMHMTSPIFNDNGEVKGIVYMVKDLSEMYRTLEESQELLLKATLIALFTTVVLGYFIARSMTKPINDLTAKVEKMADGDFKQSIDTKSNDEIGELASMFNYLRIELKESIFKLTREKNRLDIMFENMVDGVMLINQNGKIIQINHIMTDVIDISCEEIIKHDFNNLMKKLDSELTLDYMIDENIKDGNYHLHIKHSIYNLRHGLIRDEKEEVDGMIIVFQDITEQQRLDDMRKEFVADVSHELKTPITTIKSYTETLLNYDVDKESSDEFLSVIDEECDRMAKIVRELLQLSNFDAKRVKLNKENVDISKLIETIYSKIKMSTEYKNQTIVINKSKDYQEICADKDTLEQVFLNIITNAIKYTDNGGKIEISILRKDKDMIITIKDNGMGIPKKDLKRIFERFYRVDKARVRSKENGGTGLGLPIAKDIVESHGGKMLIKSEYKEGTTVKIILPIKDETLEVMRI